MKHNSRANNDGLRRMHLRQCLCLCICVNMRKNELNFFFNLTFEQHEFFFSYRHPWDSVIFDKKRAKHQSLKIRMAIMSASTSLCRSTHRLKVTCIHKTCHLAKLCGEKNLISGNSVKSKHNTILITQNITIGQNCKL